MLYEVDPSIRNLLFEVLRKAMDGLIAREDQIVIGPPDAGAPQDGPPKVHLFLHDVHENVTLRAQSFEIRRGTNEWEVGKSRKATRLNLSYLMTTHPTAAATEQSLFWQVADLRQLELSDDHWSFREIREGLRHYKFQKGGMGASLFIHPVPASGDPIYP